MQPGLIEKGLEARAELLDGQGADVLAVEMDRLRIEGILFRKVDDGVGAIDILESESGGEFFEGEEFAVVFGRPAEQAEEVDEGLGQEAGIAIGGDADHGPVLALGELGAVWRNKQRKMRELRRFSTKALEDEQMLEGVGEVILAADDVADAEVGIVNAGGKVIGGHPVRPQEGEVFDFVG